MLHLVDREEASTVRFRLVVTPSAPEINSKLVGLDAAIALMSSGHGSIVRPV